MSGVTPDPELLGDEPVRLGRRRRRNEPDERDVHDAYADSAEREVLDAEPAPVWRPPRWLVVAVLLVAVVATAGWYVDRQDRAREARALDGCRRELQTAVAFSDVRLMAMADYLDPALSVTEGRSAVSIADLMAAAGPPDAARRRASRPGLSSGVDPPVAPLPGVAARRDHGVLLGLRRQRCAPSPTQGRTYYLDTSRLQRAPRGGGDPRPRWPLLIRAEQAHTEA